MMHGFAPLKAGGAARSAANGPGIERGNMYPMQGMQGRKVMHGLKRPQLKKPPPRWLGLTGV
ncbi:hypothetical protein COCOBI_pt-0530 (chloroplast) [Coccomyxa sp. Obi]|nr:hypothetical protein COCOBI_pt-0530 [Coccomyxa sp. Obi]